MKTIEEVQNIISLYHNDASYYLAAYKHHEESYWQHIPQWIVEYSKNNIINNIIDLGAGYGTLLLFSKFINSHSNIYAVDFTPYMLQNMISDYSITYQIANMEKYDINFDCKFELIIFTECFEHIGISPIMILNKIKNILSPNGVIMFSTPDADSWGRLNYYESWKDIPSTNDNRIDAHIYQYSIQEIQDICNIVGLKIDKCAISSLNNINMQLSKGW